MRLKLSVPTSAFATNIRSALESVMLIGCQGIQFDLRHEIREQEYGETARKQLLHYLTERRMEPASGTFPLRSYLTDPNYLDDRIQAVHAAIKFASKLKLKSLILRPGPTPPADTKEYSEHLLILEDLAVTSNHFGVTLCLTPSGESAEQLQTLIQTVRSGQLAINFDFAETILSGHPIQQQLRGLFGAIGHLTARDAARGHGTAGKEVPLNQGETDWEESIALLHEMEYSGWMNVARTSGTNRAIDILNGCQYLKTRIY